MSSSNQQTLADSRANERPPMLERWNYIPWESRFRRFLDNKLEDGERMWNSIQMDLIHARHSHLMDEFDKFAAKERESLESVYERLTTLVNIMDCNNACPIPVSINTKFLNCLQPEWSKYVTMVHHNQTGDTVSYDVFYESLVQFKPHVLLSKAKKDAKSHDPLTLLAYLNTSSSQSYANSSYSSQPYYVTHPSSVVDYEDEYQGELQGDSQKNKNQAFNVGTGNDERNQIVQCVPQTESTPRKANVQCYNCNEKGHYARDFQKPRVHDAKYFKEQIFLAMKDEAGSNLNNKENDFMVDTSYREETMEELTAAVMLMARIQLATRNAETVPSYDAKAVSEVNASSKVQEQVSHVKHKTIFQTFNDDQIDSNIIFDDPYVEHNGGTSNHGSNDHDKYHEIQMLAYNVIKQ
ncbi:putative ribonuclease H-like domain-containing protein [Tanacetum coccineum]